MQRTLMQRTSKIFAIAVLMSAAAYAQSLGEVARENKEKQAAADSTAAKPKVITNQDLGEGPEGRPDLNVPRPAPGAGYARAWSQGSGQGFSGQGSAGQGWRQGGPMGGQGMGQQGIGGQSMGQQAMGGQHGEQMRRQIQEQENRVASLQARIDQMNASAHSTGANTPGAYGRSQSWQLERAAQMQRQLDEQKQKLDMMEEQARRVGTHSSVFDQ
jgi:hypothetical protein